MNIRGFSRKRRESRPRLGKHGLARWNGSPARSVWIDEPAALTRVQAPFLGGFPLPAGAVRDPTRLRVVGPQGRPVSAQIYAINRRPAGDVEWVHVAFLAYVPAQPTTTYRSDDRGPWPAPTRPLRLEDGPPQIVVDPGLLRAERPEQRFAGPGRVSVDSNGDDRFDDAERGDRWRRPEDLGHGRQNLQRNNGSDEAADGAH